MPGPLPTPYYIDFGADGARIEAGLLGPFDEHGIPLVNYDERYAAAGLERRDGVPFGVHYTPVTVCIFGFSLLQRVCTQSPDADRARERLLQLSDWLVRSMVPLSADAGVWLHEFQVPFAAGVAPPYASGIAQAHGISLLLRVNQLAPDERYLTAVHRAFGALLVDVAQGGVACIDDGYTWLEEWPSSPRSHVLNGFMFAMIAVHDYLSAFGTPAARTLWEQTLRTLEEHLPRFDCGYGSRYDLLRGLVVSETYHRLHIDLLHVLDNLSGRAQLHQTADRWATYLQSNSALKRKVMAFRANVVGNAEYRRCKFRQVAARLGLR